MEKLLSIVTPSYNCGKYIHRLLDSVLLQTYQNIEMFVIDDGSTDNTKEIVEQYIEKFVDVGKKLQYIYQENGGVARALNNGLKHINGVYFVWPDADDWYAVDNAIELLVNELESSVENIGFVRAFQNIVDEKNLSVICKNGDTSKIYPNVLFDEIVVNKQTGNWWWTPGAYMIKTKYLFENYPDKEIWNSYKDGGQNFQLLAPILYNYRCITIKKYVYNVLERSGSISREERPFEVYEKYINNLEDIFTNTILMIKNMPLSEKEKNIFTKETESYELLFQSAFRWKKKKECKLYYKKIFEHNKHNKTYKWRYFFSQLPCGFFSYKIIILSKRIISKVLRTIKGKNENS